MHRALRERRGNETWWNNLITWGEITTRDAATSTLTVTSVMAHTEASMLDVTHSHQHDHLRALLNKNTSGKRVRQKGFVGYDAWACTHRLVKPQQSDCDCDCALWCAFDVAEQEGNKGTSRAIMGKEPDVFMTSFTLYNQGSRLFTSHITTQGCTTKC